MSNAKSLKTEDEGLSDAAIEARAVLGALTPASPSFDAAGIVRIAINRSEATARFARRQTWAWRAATGLAAAVALAAWMRPPRGPAERVVVRVIHDSTAPRGELEKMILTPAGEDVLTADSNAYLVLRDRVLDQGPVDLPAGAAQPSYVPPLLPRADRLLPSSPPPPQGGLIRLIAPFAKSFSHGDAL